MMRAKKKNGFLCALKTCLYFKTQLLELIRSSMEVPNFIFTGLKSSVRKVLVRETYTVVTGRC